MSGAVSTGSDSVLAYISHYDRIKISQVLGGALMDKLFPRMYDCPEDKQIAQGGLYWFFYIIVLRFLFLLVVDGGEFYPELLIGSHALNS